MSSEIVDLCAFMRDQTQQPGLITTEEEFKKMENAVNNLLITKKQIDSLNNERNSLMLLYENKINEQNSQIKYLEEENYILKLKLEQQNSANGVEWRQKYEQCLDSIMRQLLNSLKTQETIRAEFVNLEQEDTELNHDNTLISTSNSWTFKSLSFNKSHRVQELLMLQQQQQLSLLNELSEIAKSLKTNNHSLSSLSNRESKTQVDKTPKQINLSDTSTLNSSTVSNNSQGSETRPSRIPKLNRNQRAVASTKKLEGAKANRHTSTTRIPQLATRPLHAPKTSDKHLSKIHPKMINSKTFDKKIAHISDSCIVPDCKEVKLFINKNLVDILMVSKNGDTKTKVKEDEGYSTMSSEIVHRAQNSSGGTNAETLSRTSKTSSTIDETNSHSSPIPNLNLTNSKKRYCFPTLKTLNYYYNNRYYHQYHKKSSQSSFICCKYLSDSDIQALSNQLNSFDKDLFYNVFHLDTLYNNVDYILFNSYASDTELEYNYNRRYGRYHDILDSNYQLYINDYFNQTYEDEQSDESSRTSSETEPCRNSEDNLIEYELDEEQFEFEIDASNQNFVELSVDGTDGLLFDDEDVNLIFDSGHQLNENFALNDYKDLLDKSHFDSPLFSSQSMSSLKSSTSGSNSSCDYPTSSNELSLDSINFKLDKNPSDLNCDFYMDSFENYQLHDENVMLLDDDQISENKFDISDFVNQLNKQCKSDKLLISTETSAKKLRDMTIKEAARMIQKGENESRSAKLARPSLVRRHTITTMPISAACLALDNACQHLNGYISQPSSKTPLDLTIKDTKDFVGSFTHTSISQTSTPLRRAETLHKKQRFISMDKESMDNTRSFKMNNSVASTPVKVSNNFNDEFYRLCTDTFLDCSEANFANSQSESVNSLIFKLKQVEPEHLDDLQSNASSHVNNLFDQWLVNSKN